MRALVLAVAAVCATSTTALATSGATVTGFESWTPIPANDIEPRLASLRAIETVTHVEGTGWESPDGATQALLLVWRFKPDHRMSNEEFREFAQGLVDGASKSSTKHLADAVTSIGDDLVVTTSDESDGSTVHALRRLRREPDGTVRMATLQCLGTGPSLAECQGRLANLRFESDFVFVPPEKPAPPPSKSPSESLTPFEMGRIVGVILGIVLVAAFALRRFRAR